MENSRIASAEAVFAASASRIPFGKNVALSSAMKFSATVFPAQEPRFILSEGIYPMPRDFQGADLSLG